MILGPVRYVDCLVFCLFLVPALLRSVGTRATFGTICAALPFLLWDLPATWYQERVATPHAKRHPFARKATFFEYLVTRCVKWAFANLDSEIGRVFLGPQVAPYFYAFRRWRHGYFRHPYWRQAVNKPDLRGIEFRVNPKLNCDVLVYFVHGGGFKMGCPEFYEEFLVAWLSLLVEAGYKNPGLFAIDYTLVPDARHPTQVLEVLQGYHHAVEMAAGFPSNVVISGDSAGAMLVLGLLVGIGFNRMRHDGIQPDFEKYCRASPPRLVVLISPWITLDSERDKNTPGDFLNVDRLRSYADDYSAGAFEHAEQQSDIHQPQAKLRLRRRAIGISPGLCRDPAVWYNACKRMFISYGSEEVFAGTIRDFVNYLDSKTEVQVNRLAEQGVPHAWPVASLFLSDGERRLRDLRHIVDEIRESLRDE